MQMSPYSRVDQQSQGRKGEPQEATVRRWLLVYSVDSRFVRPHRGVARAQKAWTRFAPCRRRIFEAAMRVLPEVKISSTRGFACVPCCAGVIPAGKKIIHALRDRRAVSDVAQLQVSLF